MKKLKGYTDEPIGRIRIVPNFLPPPDRLIPKVDEYAGHYSAKNRRA